MGAESLNLEVLRIENAALEQIADDVKVSVTGSRIEMTISKNFPVQVSVREEDLT